MATAIADLETIDFSKLLAHETSELSKLHSACQRDGFFYVDLQGQSTRSLLEDEDSVYEVMRQYFDQPLEVKLKDIRGTFKHGYKQPGVFSGVTENTRDNYETLKVARDELSLNSDLLPSVVLAQPRLFDDFISKSHIVNMTILSALSNALQVHNNVRFEQHHRDGTETNTALVLLRYPKGEISANVGHNKHTDIGSLTLLFSKQRGLQLINPKTNQWEWVEPRSGHAIINVGDSLRFLSEKRLASCMHRVVPASEPLTEHRYSIAYFLRPENEVRYKDPDGREISAKEWHDNKYHTFAETHEEQAKSSILMGGMETGSKQGIAV